MSEEDTFWTRMAAEPSDRVVREVFADWLQDRDDPRVGAVRAMTRWMLSPMFGGLWWNLDTYAATPVAGINGRPYSRYGELVVGSAEWRNAVYVCAMVPGPWFRCIRPSSRTRRYSDSHVYLDSRAEALRALADAYLLMTPEEVRDMKGCPVAGEGTT